MHLFVLITIYIIIIPTLAFAQQRNVDRYTPPPMFGETEKEEAPALPEMRSPNNLDLINLDSISGRNYDPPPSDNTSKAQRPAPSKAFKPPLPSRRPATLHVSQDYLDRITAPPPTVLVKPGRSAPVISPSALAGDALNADLLAMDVMDIYENLNGKTAPETRFINIPPLRNDKTEHNDVQLAFTENSATLRESQAINIDKVILPALKTGGAHITIEAPSANDADKQQQRLALSRAIAIRNYLELNGIERDHITINQIRGNTALSGNNTISLRLSE